MNDDGVVITVTTQRAGQKPKVRYQETHRGRGLARAAENWELFGAPDAVVRRVVRDLRREADKYLAARA